MKTLFPLVFFLMFINFPGWAKVRKYYLGIKETNWDYVPTGKNMHTGKPFSEDQAFHLQNSSSQIGNVYKKALYFQYTDETFQTVIEKPPWLGFVGPILKGETGDFFHVHVKNFGSRAYSFHPHGLTYTKENEGALYPDNTTGPQKKDDWLKPGDEYTYKWFVQEDQGPGSNDSNCVTRIYHSHVITEKDVPSGLIGGLLTCKRGTLSGNNEKNVDRSYFLLFSITNENASWYIEDNIKKFTKPGQVNTSDPSFVKSNQRHSINGYEYGTLPNLTMCAGDRVHWHFVGMGSVADIHPIYLHGQTLISRNHRKDTITVLPASLEDAYMEAQGPGQWMLGCQIYETMRAFFNVRNCKKTSTDVTGRHVVNYYIAAEEILWNYAPSGIDFFTGKNLTAAGSESRIYFEQNNTRIGGTYKKLVYRGYTDASFEKQTAREEHYGLLGPVIKAEVGQTIKVTFYNNASLPLSIQCHGLRYNKSNEGSFYETPGGGTPAPSSHVGPGKTFVYTWEVPEGVGPTAEDPNCLTWLYYSSVNEENDTYSGLVGPLLVCRNGSLGEDGKQKGIDKEFYLLATIFDENKSHLLDENIRTFTTEPENVNKEDTAFQSSNRMHSINGYMYGNLPGLDMCLGDNVSWHVLSVGSEKDLHGIYFSGNTFIALGARMDTVTLVPHISETLFMKPDSTGTFNVVCMTTEHYLGGMKHKYQVRQCPKSTLDQMPYNEEKTIYIAAEEIVWDYTSDKTWERELYRLQRRNTTNIYLERTGPFLGSKYKKIVYRQYNDITFTNQTERNEEEKHLDILGPLIFTKPGQVLRIVFKNNGPRPHSIHAHGVKTNSSTVVPTQPGEIRTYIWQIPERAGPTSKDFECIPWFYYSTVDVVKDLNSGLIGPLVVCRHHTKASLVHRVILFLIFDENRSWYFEENIRTYSPDPNNINRNDPTFKLSNQMHAINGKMFGDNQGLTVHVGDEVNWYLISIGGEIDLHLIHFHGHSFQYMDSGLYRSDDYPLPPGVYQTVKMFPRDVGIWLFHCHVSAHIGAGMESSYTVLPRKAKISP